MRVPIGGALATPHASIFPNLSPANRPIPSCVLPNVVSAQTLGWRPLLRPLRPVQQVRRLHPVDTELEGVPSSLFTFRPGPPSLSPPLVGSDGEGEGGSCEDFVDVIGDEPLQAGLIEEADLAGVSALLVEVRRHGVYGRFACFHGCKIVQYT